MVLFNLMKMLLLIMELLKQQVDKVIVFIIMVLLLETPMEYVQQTTHHEIYY